MYSNKKFAKIITIIILVVFLLSSFLMAFLYLWSDTQQTQDDQQNTQDTQVSSWNMTDTGQDVDMDTNTWFVIQTWNISE